MASNHGDGQGPFDPRILEAIERSKSVFGATGKFPEGHLSKDDEGEIQFGITNASGQVIINFGKPVAWLGMQPQQALAIADALVRHAKEARVIGGNRHERRVKAAKHHRSTVKAEI
jgi:hypothetical protein